MSIPSEKDRDDGLKAYETVQKETDLAAERGKQNQTNAQGGIAAENTAGNNPSEQKAATNNSAANNTDENDTAGNGQGTDKGKNQQENEDPALSAQDLAAAQEERIKELKEELARAKADLYNLDQEYIAYVKRSKADIPAHRQSGISAVVEALMTVLDDVDLARQHGDLESGPFKSVAEKLEDTLETKFGVKRYGKPGEDFDPQFHQAIQMLEGQGEDQEAHPVIVQVAQPGYLQEERVLRPAIVLVGPPSALEQKNTQDKETKTEE